MRCGHMKSDRHNSPSAAQRRPGASEDQQASKGERSSSPLARLGRAIAHIDSALDKVEWAVLGRVSPQTVTQVMDAQCACAIARRIVDDELISLHKCAR